MSRRARGLGRSGAVALLALAATALGAAVQPAPAAAGQIVYPAGTGIWAMNEDGTGKHELVDAAQVPEVSFIGDPDVQPNGTEVAFVGRWSNSSYEESAFGPAPGFCGGNCVGYYELNGGTVKRMSPAPFDCAGQPCAAYEIDPRVASDGSVGYVFQEWTSEWEWTRPVPILGRSALLSRDSSGGSPQQWSTPCHWTTAANQEATEADVLAVDPANPNEIAYANCAEPGEEEGCEWQFAAGYRVYLSGASRGAQDDELVRTVTDPGANCFQEARNAVASLSFSPDGSQLVEMHGGPGAGIYTYPATANGGASAHEVVEITGDWIFYSVRYIGGGRIAVSAGEDANHDGYADHIDIYALSSSCTPATCSLATGQGVTNLTGSGNVSSDATLNTSNFGYTTSNAPIAALPAPKPGPGPGPTPPQEEERPKKALSAALSKIPTQRLRTLLSKGLRATVSCTAACNLAASLMVPGKLAAKLHLGPAKRRRKPRNVVIGHGKGALAKAGTTTIAIRLSKRAAHSLRHAHSLHLLLEILVTGASGSGKTLTKTVAVKR